MRVIYNGLFLTRPFTGIGQYTRLLVSALAREMPDDEHVIVLPASLEIDLPANVSIEIVPLERSRFGAGVALDSWESRAFSQAADRLGADLVVTTYPTSPVKSQAPVVTTVHDMIPWQYPEYRRSLRKRIKLARQKRGIETAAAVLTVSDTSKAAITALTSVPPDRVYVTYEDVDPLYARPAGRRAITAAQERYGLERPYLIYVGGFDPRKRVPMLVEAFARSGLATRYDLVLLGSAGPDPLYEDFRRLPDIILRHKLDGAVNLPGFVPEQDKHALLSGAAAFAYPSSAEGFGLPVLEALRLRIPAVVADISVTQELFQGAATVFTPDSVSGLAQGLEVVLRQKSSRKQALKRFSWEHTARQTAEVLRAHVR